EQAPRQGEGSSRPRYAVLTSDLPYGPPRPPAFVLAEASETGLLLFQILNPRLREELIMVGGAGFEPASR
ncbi:MAG: hypothetical protein ABIS59_03585, partial [Candidatus Saccharibacteria bacterium]